MKPAILLIQVLVAVGFAATAQRFSLQPQIGLENSLSSVRYNDLSSFAPLGNQISPYIGARLDVKTKLGHGAFLGIGTNRSGVSYTFSDPETGMTSYKASLDNLKLNIQAGYQFNTKPIYLKKARSGKNVKSTSETKSGQKSCAYYRSSCGAYKSHHGASSRTLAQSKNKRWNVIIQPSLGAAFIPSVNASLSTKTEQNKLTYVYTAGNWSTALISGVGFEFDKGAQRRFSVNINYMKGIGNLNDQKISSNTEGKSIVTNLNSSTSSWNLTVGVPFTLNKKKVTKPTPSIYRYYGGCRKYRSI